MIRTYASLRLVGEHVDPDVVSRITGLRADRACRRGDVVKVARPHPDAIHTRQHGLWLITSEGQIETADLEDHVEWLLQKIEPAKDEMVAYVQETGSWADVFCFCEVAGGGGGPVLSPRLLRRMGEAGLSVSLDIYGDFRDEEEDAEAELRSDS